VLATEPASVVDPEAPPPAARVSGPGRHLAVAALGFAGLVAAVLVYQFACADAHVAVRALVLGVAVLALRFLVAGLARVVWGNQVDVGFVMVVLWIALLVLGAVLVGLLPISEALQPSKTLRTPTYLRPDLFSAHPLGTDAQGLDIFGQLLYGARVSLVIGLGATIVGAAVGGLIGAVSAYYRGVLDSVVNLVINTILAFPALIFLLAMATVLTPSVRNMTIALAILSIPLYARIARANTLAAVGKDYVVAARALGESTPRIIWSEIVPNIVLPLLSYGFVVIANLIVAEASLSFLGLGIQRPDPSWGNMISAGQRNYEDVPHVVLAPGLVLFMTVYALSRVGDRARRRWDPKDNQL
jgi:peptide/nickel transport system permease protein